MSPKKPEQRKTRNAIYYYPSKNHGAGPAFFFSIEKKTGIESIYETVEGLAENGKPAPAPPRHPWTRSFPIRELVNLHNVEGIRDPFQVDSMKKKLEAGQHLVDVNAKGPNIKIAYSRLKEWVIFDGHHSVLAYLLTGRNVLGEIPHMAVFETGFTGFVDTEICAFFDHHLISKGIWNWRPFVINWQARPGFRLISRKQKNMGALFEAWLKRPKAG